MTQSRYHRSHFLTSAPAVKDAPPDEGAEVAFAGRSNAGKSSAINTIVMQKNLARTSKTPGRTQLLNFFEVDPEHRLVDLPGYGYAKVSAKQRGTWHRVVEAYLAERQSLAGIFLAMDIRHPLTDFDCLMINWCGELGLRAHILLTKADKLGRGAAKATLLQTERALREGNDVRTTVQLFSSLDRTGLDQAHATLDDVLGYG
ncbi:ribosome biogenesis GTP-binding protein YihA/YsxC [Methylotetracoccus oryzae]|uniref:ribosome biogenesis GTP-binding protein YihA/YsxC n=1 Tax=Methylotetracoccus oryzae TaxID=1919059 RepID=UPI001F023850|nr:ribosome biogenesis GTP-binding protein YihA/YsxC [Methylotetracoccus oryzae]